MSTARAILNFDDIHENNQNAFDNENADKNDDERGNEQGGNAPKEPNTALQVLRCECSWDQGKGSIMPPTKLVQTVLVIFRWKHVQTLFLR